MLKFQLFKFGGRQQSEILFAVLLSLAAMIFSFSQRKTGRSLFDLTGMKLLQEEQAIRGLQSVQLFFSAGREFFLLQDFFFLQQDDC